MHNIILRNISDASDAFTYLNPYINKDDVRAYIKALCSRYENVAMQDQYGSEVNHTIETIQYRNERAIMLEKFFGMIIDPLTRIP